MLKKNTSLLIIASILLMGAIVRFNELGVDSLRTDEIFTATRAKENLVSLFIKSPEEAGFGYSPIDRIFVHLALVFSKSEFAVRTPSAIVGTVSVLIIYLVGKYFFNSQIGIIAAFILSISSLHLEYSQEARYYVYTIFFSLVSLLFLQKTIKEKKKKYWIIFAISIFLSIFSHLSTLILITIQILFLFLSSIHDLRSYIYSTKSKKRFLIFFTLGVLFLIIISIYLKDYSALLGSIKVKSPDSLLDLVKYTLEELSGNKDLALLFYLVIFSLGIILGLKTYRKETFLLATIFFIPPIILLFARPEGYDYHIRYIIFILPVYLLIIAVGIERLFKVWTRGGHLFFLLLILGAFGFFSVKSIENFYHQPQEDWRGLGQFLKDNLKPGDVLIVESKYRKMTTDYYYDTQTENTYIKTSTESLPSRWDKYPFTVNYLQHDYVLSSGLPNLAVMPIINPNKIKSFKSGTSLLYLARSNPIYFWQETESDWITNRGWIIIDLWGQKVISTDSLNFPNAEITYHFSVLDEGNYDIYANLRWDGARGFLKFKIDGENWSDGIQPFFGEKGDVVRNWKFKELNLGTRYLKSGDHQITFLNLKTNNEIDRYQTIDYFYLVKKVDKIEQ